MHNYRVIECRTDQNRLLLEGGIGRFHWARVLNEAPQVGDFLSGSRPHLGFGLLRCTRSGRTVRVIFETIGSADTGIRTRRTPDPMLQPGVRSP